MPMPDQPPAVLVQPALALTLVPTVLVLVLAVLTAELGGRWPPSRPGWGRLIWPGVLMRSWSS